MSVLNAKQLTAKIKSIKGSSVKLRDNIQEALVSCSYYAIKDGDAGSFNRLIDAVGTNTRIKGLTMWAETWGAVRVKEGKLVINKSVRDSMSVTDEASFAEYEAMMRAAVPWYDMTPAEKATSMFDPINYITGVVSKLEKEHQAELAEYVKNAVLEFNKAKVLAAVKAQEAEVQAA
jgi:hypothetical protein